MGDVIAIPERPSDDGGKPLPDVLTVEEAARLLRISRNLAFQQAALYRETDGKEGIPNYRLGRCLRVPTAELLGRFGIPRSTS